jgi:transposase
MLRKKTENSMQYSNDLRRKLVEAWLTGESTQIELADLFHVSLGWVEKVLRRWRTRIACSNGTKTYAKL